MGADGGVVYIRLRNPSKYSRVEELLRPFWQFLDPGGRSDWAEDSTIEWENQNPNISSPDFLLGYYGTDRADNQDLHDLANICQMEIDELCQLTFSDLDLECRTWPGWGQYYNSNYGLYPLHALWLCHFRYDTHEEVVKRLGGLASMRVIDWTQELGNLLHLQSVGSEETWT